MWLPVAGCEDVRRGVRAQLRHRGCLGAEAASVAFTGVFVAVMHC